MPQLTTTTRQDFLTQQTPWWWSGGTGWPVPFGAESVALAWEEIIEPVLAGISNTLKNLLKGWLEEQDSERWESAASFADALEEWALVNEFDAWTTEPTGGGDNP